MRLQKIQNWFDTGVCCHLVFRRMISGDIASPCEIVAVLKDNRPI